MNGVDVVAFDVLRHRGRNIWQELGVALEESVDEITMFEQLVVSFIFGGGRLGVLRKFRFYPRSQK